jgi:drug/metabolite transporter (DMT)-like permease
VAAGVLGVAMSAPIASATAAPALAVAFWRSALGALATAPVVGLRARAEVRALTARGAVPSVLSGVLLAVHFGLWLPSLRLTSVTAATALVATTPVWTVALDRLRGVPVPPQVLLGVALALGGVLAVTGADAGRSWSALAGDALAVGGGMAGAGYVVVGERARATASTPVYTSIAYGTCAAVLVPVCLVAGASLAGYDTRTWVELLVLTAAAQLLGHTALNAALPAVGATPLSLAILLEVPGAALVAWAWLGQVPPVSVVPGAVLVLAGLVVVVRSRRAEGTRPVDVELDAEPGP